MSQTAGAAPAALAETTASEPVRGRRRIDQREAAQSASTIPGDASCCALGTWWSEMEGEYVRSNVQAQIDLTRVIRNFCRGCPAMTGCADWARTDRYTGYAAGVYFSSGVPRRSHRGAAEDDPHG